MMTSRTSMITSVTRRRGELMRPCYDDLDPYVEFRENVPRGLCTRRALIGRAKAEHELLPLRLPSVLALTVPPERAGLPQEVPETVSAVVPDTPRGAYQGGLVEFDRVVLPSGNVELLGKQIWLGTARAHLLPGRDTPRPQQ